MDQQIIRLTDLSHVQKRTATLVLNVRTMAASPAEPPAPLQFQQPPAGRSPNVDPVMTEEQRSACPMSWLHSKDMPQCGYCILPAGRCKADVLSGSLQDNTTVQRQSEWALQDAEDERLLQEEDVAGAFGKTSTWAVQHAGLSETCSSADDTSAVPHPAALCSMVVTEVSCAADPTCALTAGLNEQHQQHLDRNSSQGHYQSNDTTAPRTTGSRFDRLEIETAGTAVLNEGVESSAAPQAQQLSQSPVDPECPIQNEQPANNVLVVEARRDSAPADHAPDSMPKDAPSKITATSRPEAPATADPAAAKPVPEAEEGVTNAETSPNLQAVPSPCNTSNLNDENDCALNEHCSCIKCTIQTYKDLKDSNATYQTTKGKLSHVKELIAGFDVYSDPDLGTLGLPPLDDPGGILPRYSQKHKEIMLEYATGKVEQAQTHREDIMNKATLILLKNFLERINAVLATEINYTTDNKLKCAWTLHYSNKPLSG